MFVQDFLNNPSGKGNAVLNIKTIQSNYIEKYNKIANLIKYQIFLINSDIYFLINIPSSVNGIYYDIVVKFKKTSKSAGNSILDMDFQVFSNSPSFLYTYAYAYEKHGLFIKEFKRKMSSQMIKKVAETRNPYAMLSYDFSIFASLYFIIKNDYTSMDTINRMASKINLHKLLDLVKNADALQKDRKNQKAINKELEKKALNEKKKHVRIGKEESDEQNTGNVRHVKSVKNVKKSKTVKKTKKIK